MLTDATTAEMQEHTAPASEVKDCSQEEEPQVEKQKGFNVGEIIEGKREKKKVERLVQSVQLAKPKERLKIESGDGDKLGEIARINHNIGKMKAPLLKPLHKVLFDRPGAASSMKKNLRLFSGFPFKVDSDLYFKKMKILSKYTNTMLKTICQVLDVERSGKQSVLIERIMAFLMHPVNTGKPVPIKKKKKKKRKNTAVDTKKKTNKVAKSPKKSMVEGKSKAIVTDSSSDDDDDDDDKPESKEAKMSVAQESRKKKGDLGDSSEDDKDDVEDDDDDDDDEDDEEEEETPKSKSPAKKKAATPKKVATSKKTTKSTLVKKKVSAKKTEDESDASVKSESDDSDNPNDSDFEKSKKKPAAKKTPAKPAPKTKKADSSSNKTTKKHKVLQDSDDSSDDDKPLIKMIKRPPTDDQIKTTVKDLLKDANLEEVTMKQLCQKVYDAYPEFDLTSRKDYIKQTVKSLIS